MGTPFESNFNAATATEDDATSLVDGVVTFASTLTNDLDIGMTMTVTVDDEIVDVVPECLNGGILRINNELILFQYIDLPYFCQRLARGYAGTTEADHNTGDTVTIYTQPKFTNPAITALLIQVQSTLVDHESRIQAVEP
jgi:hypothetical protein